MLRLMNPVEGYRLEAQDGLLGSVKDFLFDEEFWTVRHIVADTRHWLPGRKVLISPVSVKEIDWTSRQVAVSMTKEEVKKAPELNEDEPVSRAYERRWYDAYGFPYYWGTADVWGGGGVYPMDLLRQTGRAPNVSQTPENPEEGDRVLRSAEEVRGYHIQAHDGEVGHVHDFIMDDETWTIRYLVVDTRNWLPGQKVLLAPGWMNAIHWAESDVTTSLSRDAIKSAPPFDPDVAVNRAYEQKLYDYYGRPAYWGT